MSDRLTPKDVKEFLQKYNTPELARKFLMEAGFLNEDGSLSSNYYMVEGLNTPEPD